MSNTSFDKIIDSVFDSLKKLTPALLALLIASSFILFAPEEFMNKIAEYGIGVKPITTYEIDVDFFKKI